MDIISPAEEAALLRYYQQKLMGICENLKLPKKVLNTAVTYVKRFYIKRSVFEYDPQHIVLVCLYLACKTEDCYLSAAELGRLVGMPAEVLLKMELVLLQGLNFDLHVHSVHRALDGWLMDLTDWMERIIENTMSETQQNDLRSSAYKAADVILLSDAPLLFTPAQLGLAALDVGLTETLGQHSIRMYLNHTAKHHGPGDVDDLTSIVGKINAVGKVRELPQEGVAAIDRRLKAFRKSVPMLSRKKANAV